MRVLTVNEQGPRMIAGKPYQWEIEDGRLRLKPYELPPEIQEAIDGARLGLTAVKA